MSVVHEIRDPKSKRILHLVIRALQQDILDTPHRSDVVDPENFLQVATMGIPSGTRYRAHIHLERSRQFSNFKAQESWVVLSGKVKANFYDEEGILLESIILGAGEASFTLHGGHSYEGIEDAIVLEYKSGPYEGQEIDKRFLD